MSEFQRVPPSSKTSDAHVPQSSRSNSKSSQKDALNQPSMEGLSFPERSDLPLTREQAEAGRVRDEISDTKSIPQETEGCISILR